MRYLAEKCILWYQRSLSGGKKRCRFYPTCSNYALMALRKYGFVKGMAKSVWRICRCNRWNYGSCVDFP